MLRGERHHEAGHDEAEEGDEEDEGDADHAETGLDHGVDDGGRHHVDRGQSLHRPNLLPLVGVTGSAVRLQDFHLFLKNFFLFHNLRDRQKLVEVRRGGSRLVGETQYSSFFLKKKIPP